MMFSILIFIAAAGFLLRKKLGNVDKLVSFQASYLRFWLPIMLFLTTALRAVNLKQSISEAGLYYISSVVFMLLVFVLFLALKRKTDASVAALTASFTNTVMIGAPVFEALGAQDVAQLLYMVIPLNAFTLFGTASLLGLITSQKKKGWTLKGKLPPITWALAAGLCLSPWASHYAGAEFIRTQLTFVMQITTFFVLGISIGGLKIEKITEMDTGMLTLLKLVFMPLFVFATFQLLGFKNSEAAIFIAALPVGINVLGYANPFGKNNEATVSATIFLSTAGSLVTLPLLYWIFKPH